MKPFAHVHPTDLTAALRAHPGDAATAWTAGGTTQIDLMKLGVALPERLVDLGSLRRSAFAPEDHGEWLRLSAFMTMRDAADHSSLRQRLPVLVESLSQAASRQIRTMATLGGNLLQRTRCGYFRDTSWTACNRRSPGSGCAARENTAWAHAVLGTSDQCMAVYPGDFAQALIALDAQLEVEAHDAAPRLLSMADLHRLPGDHPEREWNLAPGELITALRVPVRPWFSRSRYVKVRDRASFEFALASAAVALDLGADRRVREARIALGGGATVPWRSREAEAAIAGKRIDEGTARAAADAAYATAEVREDTRARLEVGKATLVRALLETGAMETSRD